MRNLSHALALVLLLTCGCACPPPASTETPTGGGTAPALDPGTQPAPTDPPPAAGGGDRQLAVAASHAQYARVEGTSFQNGCQTDNQCFVGGCSSEICTAEEGVSGTCEMPVEGWPSKGASCGCVAGQCVWFRSGAAAPTGDPNTPTGPGAGSSGSGPGAGTPGPGSSGSAPGSGKPDKPGAGKPDKPGAGKPDKPGAGSGGALPKQAENCTADEKCAAGLTCKKYFGIAGARGPEFKTCEIPCSGKGSTCPAGQTCITIADGPGQVCRPK